MTNEEMERAIEFLLSHQTTLEQRVEQITAAVVETNAAIVQTNAQVAQTNAQIAETARLLGLHAETQTQFIEITTQNFTRVFTALEQLTARVDKLTDALERHVADAHAHEV